MPKVACLTYVVRLMYLPSVYCSVHCSVRSIPTVAASNAIATCPQHAPPAIPTSATIPSHTAR